MRYLSAMLSVSTVHLYMINTSESIQKNRQMWAYLKEKDPTLYKEVRFTPAGFANRKTTLGRAGTCVVYGIARTIFK